MSAAPDQGLKAPRLDRPDIAAARRSRVWSRRELFARALWEGLRGPLFAWTPRPLWGWRRGVLRLFGARIGAGARLHPTVRVAVPWRLSIGEDAAIGDRAILYSLGRIEIGPAATVSQGAHLCAGSHDYARADLPLLRPPIRIGAGAWICADAFIGPGVAVGELAVIGARAVVMKDAPARAVLAGNPARIVKQRPALTASAAVEEPAS